MNHYIEAQARENWYIVLVYDNSKLNYCWALQAVDICHDGDLTRTTMMGYPGSKPGFENHWIILFMSFGINVHKPASQFRKQWSHELSLDFSSPDFQFFYLQASDVNPPVS